MAPDRDLFKAQVREAVDRTLQAEMTDLPGEQFSTTPFEQFQRSEGARVRAGEVYVQGVSTPKMTAITDELCGHRFTGRRPPDAASSWPARY